MTRLDRYGDPIDDQVAELEWPHDGRCRAGWLGEDAAGHPIPCPTCRPHLATCPTCGTARLRCDSARRDHGARCCPGCPHRLPTKALRRSTR